MNCWLTRAIASPLRTFGLCVTGAVVGLTALWSLCPKPPLYPEDMAFSRAMEDRDGQVVHLALTPDGKYRLHSRLQDLSPALIKATLTLEDQHYQNHPGVNPASVARALWGVVSGSRQGGGSTITMQYARLRFGLRTTTYHGKILQMLRALQMARHYSKDEVLEAYFNLAPYGGNVEGAAAASLLWCGKPVRELSLREGVALAVLPQSPARRQPRLNRENPAQTAAVLRLWRRLQNRDDPLDKGFALRPEAPVPREAPHLARRLFNQQPNNEVVRSTIDLTKQHSLEKSIADGVAQWRGVGITNACAVLVHAPSREVLAYVGSAGFLNRDILGQVDGIKARRSPGSALKPFIYALAMQQGLIHPNSLVKDGRLTYADYNPENFDREFAGPIPASEALFRSRNIPAVRLAEGLNKPGLYGFLKAAGVRLPKPEAHYGLALPLGGGEVSPEELAALYCLLASDGLSKKLSLSPKAGTAESTPLLTPEVRFLTREMLRAPAGSGLGENTDIVWKTGTSHGYRDAWAAGICGDYVLVVWIGHFDGRTNPAFVARESAAPLMFQAFARLALPTTHTTPPPGVAKMDLCAVSGQLPNAFCQHRVTGWFIPGVSSVELCDIHREVLIDPSSGLRVAEDDGVRKLRKEVWEVWPPDLLDMFKKAGVPRREPPPFELGSTALAYQRSHAPPHIVSPQSRRIYSLRANDAARQSIPLRADVAAGVHQVFWFADKQFLGSTGPVEPLMWKAAPGQWRIRVLDDQGRDSTCEVKVEMVE